MTSVAVEVSRWMCGGRPSNRSARAHRIGGGVRCLRPAAKAVGRCPEVGGTARGATAAVTRCGCRRGDSSRGTNSVAGMASCAATGFVRWQGGTHGNAANPRIGSRLQYACDFRGRQPAEVVQNHVSGTVPGVASRNVPAAATLTGPNPEGRRWRGVPTNPRRGGRRAAVVHHRGGSARVGMEASKRRQRPRRMRTIG